MGGNNVKEVTDSSFESDVVKSDKPVLVDFWAEWCGPCKAVGPILTEIANQYTGKLSVCKVNVDENPQTSTQFGIRSIPTIMLFHNGKVVDQLVGAVPKSAIEETLQKVI